MSSAKPKLVVTGASGLLGRQVVIEAKKRGTFDVIGLSFTRTRDGLRKLDLTDEQAVREFFAAEKPQAMIHCAAERRPNVARDDPEGTRKLNVQVTGALAREAKVYGTFFVYISTEYVFDGLNPPYNINDKPNPINLYGQTKLEGEQAALEANPRAAVLRVPLLYGRFEYESESAVSVLLDPARDTSKVTQVDAVQTRFPTCIDDISRVLIDMVEINSRILDDDKSSDSKGVQGIFHISSTQSMTKYDMCVFFAQTLGIADTSHIVAAKEPPSSSENSVQRPKNTQLSNDSLEQIGIKPSFVSFTQWWEEYLANNH
ncbi:hypothetical protein J3B02_000038 [Coemansia erecta]|uniref:RmlD-like substrate binding domain-containing protein n=1 Tax=Coemansia asiatica TaxID=1052880 RepID=A0A9W7XL48_9FUNG|nr:hypothetical protein LPJ64_001557 [Coemansia asiatica]KAJ2858657.1 hypothetical protein J3B02_000038 [Coemansia erecta]